MSLTPSQAADSLKEIEKTARSSASAYGYAKASPYFILWGVIWMVGYGVTDLLPRTAFLANYFWLLLTLIGVAGCFAIGRRQKKGGDPAKARAVGQRIFGTFIVIYVFITGTFMIMRPTNPAAALAFAPLVVSMFYALMGVWKGLRFLAAGVILALLTMGGFFLLREHFALWMAVVGGGSLVLVGLWLRKV